MVTLLLVLANIAVYLTARDCACVYGLIPAHPTLESAFTSLFFHDPADTSHLLANMVFLVIFGLFVEARIGHLKFGALYLVAGLAGGFLHVTVDPSSTTPLVGASGAIFGVLAAAAAIQPRLVGFAFVLGAIQVWHALTGAVGTVSFGAHIGGFAAGVVFAALFRVFEDTEE